MYGKFTVYGPLFDTQFKLEATTIYGGNYQVVREYSRYDVIAISGNKNLNKIGKAYCSVISATLQHNKFMSGSLNDLYILYVSYVMLNCKTVRAIYKHQPMCIHQKTLLIISLSLFVF
jgi:hypothetical protein